MSLSETGFTNLCKFGFLVSFNPTREEIYMTKNDIRKLAKGEMVEKDGYNSYKIILQDIGMDLIKQIIKRTPLYSDISEEL